MGPLQRLASGVLVLAMAFGLWVFMPEKVEAIAQGASGSSAPLAQEVESIATDPAAVGAWFKGLLSSAKEGIAQAANSAAASPAGDYDFLQEDNGAPVRWNPCEPIHYVVNSSSALPGAEGDVAEALTRIGAATGLTFVYDGPTDSVATQNWYQTSWSGRDYAPLIVSWSSIEETDMLKDITESGRAVANPAVINGVKQYVTGAVVLNSAQNELYPAGFGEGMNRGNLLLHELGHIVGLAHAKHTDEAMYPQIGSFSSGSFSTADLEGLALLGSTQGCTN